MNKKRIGINNCNEWYQDTAVLLDKKKDYSVYKFKCTGKGILYTYNVFDGIDVIFAEMNSKDVFITEIPDKNIIEVSWCKKGRVECEFSDNTIAYIQEGDFGIDANTPKCYKLPIEIYEAVTIAINKEGFSQNTRELMNQFSIDIDQICDTLGLDKGWYICKTDSKMEPIFQEMYAAMGIEDGNYFSIKTLELLHHLQYLSEINGYELKYFTKYQIQKVKEAINYLVSHLGEKISMEEYVLSQGMRITTFRNIFVQIFGETPSIYIKKYKMAVAALKLKEKNRSITDLALSLGYSNPSKFTKAFREIYGVRPKDYRKLIED